MKTLKIFLIIAGFAFSGICFGQLQSGNNSEVLFYSAHYNLAHNRIEHQLNEYPARTTSGDNFEAPVFARAYYVPANIDLSLEAWMTLPFESSFYEEDIRIESWMESPFNDVYYDMDLPLEPWMTKPFESGEEIEIEDWMTTPWTEEIG